MPWHNDNSAQPTSIGNQAQGSFIVTRRTESLYDNTVGHVEHPLFISGVRQTISDARHKHEVSLALTRDMSAWANGREVSDHYAPEAGEVVMFKMAAKNRAI